MNSLVRDTLQRLPRKGEWVFTKPNEGRILPSAVSIERVRQPG